jgi:hypothetical protein
VVHVSLQNEIEIQPQPFIILYFLKKRGKQEEMAQASVFASGWAIMKLGVGVYSKQNIGKSCRSDIIDCEKVRSSQ